MHNKRTLLLYLLLFVPSFTVAQTNLETHTGFFANAKEVFRPLIADPREIQVAARLVTPPGKKFLGEISAGEYLGLYRWKVGPDSYVQWSVAGGVFARFDLVADTKDNQVIDYYAEMPVDFRSGKWSGRFLPYHVSSHLGDDYIKRTGILPEKYSVDAWKWLLAFEPTEHWRFYAGPTYIIRWTYAHRGHYAMHSGVEWRSNWWADGHAQTFWGNDLQNWQRVGWNPSFNSQLGVKIIRSREDAYGVSVFGEFGTGHRPHGQFYYDKETHWNIGLRFEIP